MFLSRIRAEDRSPYGQFWFEPVGVRTGSGARVTADSAMQLSAVFRAVSLVSGHMALLPIKFYKRGSLDQIEHPLLRLLNRRPNKWQNAFEWREMLQGHLELRGNCYNEIFCDLRGQITDLIPRHPDRVKIEMLSDGDYRYRITDPDGTQRTAARDSIWHIRGLSSNGIVGLSVIEYARESFGLGLSAQSYGARFFANDAKPAGGWVEFPGSYKDKGQRDQVRESIQDAQSGSNRGKLMLLDHGLKYHEVGVTNDDAQFLETRQFQTSDIARWFGVPPHKIGDLSKSAFSNIEQQAIEYITDALLARAGRVEASIEADLLFDHEEIDVEYDFDELLRGDSTARAALYHSGILDGWMVRNEARAKERMQPIDGLDEPLRPLNMTEESQAEDADADLETSEPPEPKESANQGADARMVAVIRSAAERVARKELQVMKVAFKQENWPEAVKDSYVAHAGFVASCMGCTIEEAQAYCKARGTDPMNNATLEEDFMAAALSRLERLALTGKP